MAFPKHLTLRLAACLSAFLLSASCGSSDRSARDALSAYQSAAAANDLTGARKALLQLVRAKDDVADYWVELGKLQASMGNFSDAYYAFTRAYELDRRNVDVLRAVTQLALRSGDVGLARSHAEELEVLSPGDPWVKLTDGWAAYSESHFDRSLSAADAILASSPFDPSGTVLKARTLLSLNRDDEAVELLTKQIKSQPSDLASQQLLARIYAKRGDWEHVASVAKQMYELNSRDLNNALLLIAGGFRSGDVAIARKASLDLLHSQTDPAQVASVLNLWTDYWPSPQRINDARALAAAASGLQQRLLYANFLSRVGSPADGIRLSSDAAGLPISAGNSEANAVFADALARTGNSAQATSRFDAVIAFDPGNATALRGRAELELRTGKAPAAILDAQKLVTVLPNSSSDRLLLARSYSAAGNPAWMERTLWTAFQEIPADEKIYGALLTLKKGNAEETGDLKEEFDRQRSAKLNRGLL